MQTSKTRAYQTRMQRQRRRRSAYRAHGAEYPEDLFPAFPLRKLFNEWLARRPPMSNAEIARLCGVQKGAVQQFRTDRKFVTRHLRDAILELMKSDARAPAANELISNERALQLLGSLQAQGWSLEQLAGEKPELKFTRESLNKFIYQGNSLILRSNEDRIRALAQHVGDRKGPSPIAAARARKRGYYPLIHYTESGKLIKNSIPNN